MVLACTERKQPKFRAFEPSKPFAGITYQFARELPVERRNDSKFRHNRDILRWCPSVLIDRQAGYRHGCVLPLPRPWRDESANPPVSVRWRVGCAVCLSADVLVGSVKSSFCLSVNLWFRETAHFLPSKWCSGLLSTLRTSFGVNFKDQPLFHAASDAERAFPSVAAVSAKSGSCCCSRLPCQDCLVRSDDENPSLSVVPSCPVA